MGKHWTDKELLNGINERNNAAFEIFHNRIMKPLLNFIFRIVNNTMDAEDLASETFIRFWKTTRTFESLKHAENYIYSAARKNSLTFLKSPAHAKQIPLPDELSVLIDNDTEGEINRAAVISKLYELIKKLPPSRKKEILLLTLEYKTTDEIAQILKKDKKYVLNRKLAAIKLLQKLFNTGT
jgi:RNA polymerase sigma-70 factor (ECF subfamily)